MEYRQLKEKSILRTLEQLRGRIAERFPESGLSRVASELLSVGHEVASTVDYLKRPNYAIRAPVWIAITLMAVTSLGVLLKVLPKVLSKVEVGDIEILQVFESGVNSVVFVGIAMYFLLSIETKVKRARALKILHELRSLAHVVDMHQLSKDPANLFAPSTEPPEPGEPELTPELLKRYLDHCSDLLAVTSKLAAMLVQNFSDEIVLGTVNEIETLTGGLSVRIWQKITLIDRPGMVAS